MGILDQIWEGRSPKGKAFGEDISYAEVMHRLSERDVAFRVTLSPEQEEQLDTMQNEESALSAVNGKNMFRYGFCMGVRLMLEVLEESL